MCVRACVHPGLMLGQIDGLGSTGETAHPAISSIGTWCKLGKKMPTVHVLHTVGSGGTSDHHIFICET